jgi:peptidylprolyl isomerase
MRLRGLMITLLLAVVALYALGCGGGNGDSSSSSSSLSPEPDSELAAEGAILASQPNIEVPTGLPPKKLVIKDLQKGTGAEAEKGDKVQIQYYGVQWNGGVEHANSWHYEHIPVFELGSHRLLRGLNIAIHGMKEGGGREVIIPYNFVYYPGDEHNPLSPLDALIYKVYLVKVIKAG